MRRATGAKAPKMRRFKRIHAALARILKSQNTEFVVKIIIASQSSACKIICQQLRVNVSSNVAIFLCVRYNYS